MNMRLSIPDDLVIRSSDLRLPDAPIGLGALTLTLGGDLTAAKDPGGELALTGVVRTIRGTYTFQNRRFTILRDGSIRFDGGTPIDPILDVRTERIIQGVVANVNVRGTARKPEIQLTSTPPLEPADIMALIVFNRPANELGTGEQISLAQRAEQLATGAVAGSLANSIGSALNLDMFEISTAPDSGAAAAVTVGEQLGQDLYLKVEQDIGEQSGTNVVLEYQLLEWLRVRSNVRQGSSATQQQLFRRTQDTGADLLFFFSY
jgi:translocation and assembly module TamB